MHSLLKITDGRIDVDTPVYVIDDGKLYRTVYHPLGWTDLPDYEMKNDGRIYRTGHHCLGFSETPDFEFRKDGCLYRSASHPDGASSGPDYALS
ncbi:MAG: hypothetical protein ABIL58_14715 [Pseudomonadota bacterium]